MTDVDDDRRHHLDVPEVAHRLLRLLEECSAEPRVLEPGVDREHAEVAVIAVLLDEHTSDELAVLLGEQEARVGHRHQLGDLLDARALAGEQMGLARPTLADSGPR